VAVLEDIVLWLALAVATAIARKTVLRPAQTSLHLATTIALFLAGFAVVHKKRRLFAEALDAIGKVSFAFFIPVYFAIVGLKLDLIRGASLSMRAAFILGSCAVKVAALGLAGRFDASRCSAGDMASCGSLAGLCAPPWLATA
jgi:Kef-type K+ transport system membrane component KefB